MNKKFYITMKTDFRLNVSYLLDIRSHWSGSSQDFSKKGIFNKLLADCRLLIELKYDKYLYNNIQYYFK